MTKYEIMYILDTKSDTELLQKKIEDVVLANGGSLVEKEQWGNKDFAYPINKQKQGFYGVLICNTNSENIDELLHINKINKNIIRLLIINTEHEKNYIQSTKLSKTEIKQEKIEHKSIGKRYERRVINIEEKNTTNSSVNTNT